MVTMPESMSLERTAAAQGLRRRDRADPALEGMHGAVRAGRGDRRRDTPTLHAPAVREPGQPRDPPRGRRPRRSGATPTARSTPGLRRRHRRDDHRRRRGAQGAPARGAGGRRRAGDLAGAPQAGRAAGPHKIQGIGAGFVPDVLERAVIDEVIPVDDETAFDERGKRPAARAFWWGSRPAPRSTRRWSWPPGPSMSGKRVVVIVPDGGERYMSLPFFAPE